MQRKTLVSSILGTWAVILCISCATSDEKELILANVSGAETFIVLPAVDVDIRLKDGLQKHEAERLSAHYFERFIVGLCGMPDKPEEHGSFWRIQLWGGFAGSDFGRLWLSKDGRQSLFEPPASGIRGSTRRLLELNKVPYN